MDTVQMENILNNLTNLEMSFRQLAPNLNYHDLNTYKRFLEHFFIREHRLESVYWPQLPEPASHSHRFLTSYTEIERLPLFRAGNIIMMKNPNLPFSHMLKNDFFQCIYIMEGGATLNLEHMEKSLEKGDFLILFPDVNHLLTPSESAIAINILIEKNQMYSKKYPILDCYAATDDKGVKRQLTSDDTEYLLLHTVENDDIRTIILKMFTEYLQSLDYKEEILESYLTLLFVYLMRYQQNDAELSFFPDASQQVFYKIYHYCLMNLKSASLNEAAKYLNYSKQYLCRIVKEMTGQTFTKMLTDMKIETAKKYMLESQLTFGEIAELTGFTEASYLSRIFKKYEGISPSKFMEKNRNLS